MKQTAPQFGAIPRDESESAAWDSKRPISVRNRSKSSRPEPRAIDRAPEDPATASAAGPLATFLIANKVVGAEEVNASSLAPVCPPMNRWSLPDYARVRRSTECGSAGCPS
jgi:hypothetical protein